MSERQQSVEQARESIKSLTDSFLSGSFEGEVRNLSYADDENISVFYNDSINTSLTDEATVDTSAENVSNASTALEITTSVSDRVDTLGEEEPDREKIHLELSRAYGTCMKRFERAVGDNIINNNIIKLLPVSPIETSTLFYLQLRDKWGIKGFFS